MMKTQLDGRGYLQQRWYSQTGSQGSSIPDFTKDDIFTLNFCLPRSMAGFLVVVLS